MTWRETLRAATEAVRTHRLRSGLTVFGILIGIAAVTLTVGLGNGARADVRDQISELGSNILVITPGGGSGRAHGTPVTPLTRDEANGLASKSVAPDIESVAPVVTAPGSLSYGTTNWTTTLTGTTSSWEDVRSREVSVGRFITEADDAATAKVVVLGSRTATALFSSAIAAVGQDVIYNGGAMHVVGVLRALSSSENAVNNDLALVPISTFSQRLVGGANRENLQQIYVKATSSDTLTAAYQEASALLRNLHNVTTIANTDFTISTQQSLLSTANGVNKTLSVMLLGIATIALLVGGIGVMNIMLVSVTERVREIGLRKALGARPALIRRQFLVEASVLGLAGGLLGVGVGALGVVVIPHLTGNRIVLSVLPSMLAVVIAVAVALLFGVYPASRASRLAPIDALRSE